MTTNYLRKLLTAVVCLLASVTVNAQFTGKVDQVPRTDYVPESASFSISEVAEALGTDQATLLAALDSWIAEGSTDANMFFYAAPSAPDTWADGYTTGGEKGFWLNEDAEITAYGDGSAYYCNPGWDAEAGTFIINIGMMPDALKYGVYQKELKFALQYGDKTATFTIDFTVTGGEKVDLPEIKSLKESDLNIVGEAEVTVEQMPRNVYDADAVSIRVVDMAEKLGVSGSVLKDYLGEMLYCTKFDTETVGKCDSVSNESTANEPGFWVTDIRVNDEATGECSAAAYSQGCKFYMQSFAFDEEENTITFDLGQYPNNLKGEEAYFVYLYVIYGDKAYRLRVNFNVLLPEQGETLADFTKVGEETVNIEANPGGYTDTKMIHPDMDAIAAALGCAVSDIQMAALQDDVDFGNSTANNGGFWFNIDGYVCSWGDNAMYFIEPSSDQDWSELKLGQYPDHMNIGDESTTNLYFLGNGNYYQMTINLKIVEPTVIDATYESVAQRSYIVQQQPSGYEWSDGIEIPYDFIQDNLGTSDWTVYGLAVLDEEGNEPEGNAKYVKNYTITESPGFWLDKNGRNSGWGDNSYFGISAGGNIKGMFQLMQYPDRCQSGETYKTQLFFVDESTGKMVTFNFTYNIVDEIVQYETVGTESVTLPVSMSDSSAPIDLTAAAEALGLSVDELLEGRYLNGMTEGGYFGGASTSEDGLTFNAQGFYDLENPCVSFSIAKSGDDIVVTAWAEEEVAEDFRLSVQCCYMVDNKQYVFEMKFVSDAAYEAGIEGISVSGKRSTQVYDLSGRKVGGNPRSGLYIQNGKKKLVK